MTQNQATIFFSCTSIEDELNILTRHIIKERWNDVIIFIPSKWYLSFVRNYLKKLKFRFQEQEINTELRDNTLPLLMVSSSSKFHSEMHVNCYLFYQTIINKMLFINTLKSTNTINHITFSNLDEDAYKSIFEADFSIINRSAVLNPKPESNRVHTDHKSVNASSHIVNKEIREKFIDTFRIAEEEIDIISPWMSESVVDSDFIRIMDDCLQKNVKIRILYGIGDDSDYRNRMSDEIRDKLVKRFQKYGDLFKIRKSNIHYKLLICDFKYLITGSFNFLSFRGEYDGIDDRLEGADIIKTKSEISIRRNKYFDFDEEK